MEYRPLRAAQVERIAGSARAAIAGGAWQPPEATEILALIGRLYELEQRYLPSELVLERGAGEALQTSVLLARSTSPDREIALRAIAEEHAGRTLEWIFGECLGVVCTAVIGNSEIVYTISEPVEETDPT